MLRLGYDIMDDISPMVADSATCAAGERIMFGDSALLMSPEEWYRIAGEMNTPLIFTLCITFDRDSGNYGGADESAFPVIYDAIDSLRERFFPDAPHVQAIRPQNNISVNYMLYVPYESHLVSLDNIRTRMPRPFGSKIVVFKIPGTPPLIQTERDAHMMSATERIHISECCRRIVRSNVKETTRMLDFLASIYSIMTKYCPGSTLYRILTKQETNDGMGYSLIERRNLSRIYAMKFHKRVPSITETTNDVLPAIARVFNTRVDYREPVWKEVFAGFNEWKYKYTEKKDI